MKNRDEAKVAKFMPSGWTNGRLPKQKIIFEYEGQEIKVEYSQKEMVNSVFQTIKLHKYIFR